MERDSARNQFDRLIEHSTQDVLRAEAAEAALARVKPYVQHTASCDRLVWPNGIPIGGPGYGPYGMAPVECTCGLSAALVDKEAL